MIMYLNVVHGTVTEVPAWEGHVEQCMLFDNLNFNHPEAKTKAVYFTDNKDICKFFSDEKNHDPSSMMQTVITADIKPNNPYIMDITPTDAHSYEGIQYLWPEERDAFYDKLREDGFDAVIINGGYRNAQGEFCADIAALDPDIVHSKSISLKINGKWTPEMSKSELQDRLTYIANNPEALMASDTIGQRETDYDDFSIGY